MPANRTWDPGKTVKTLNDVANAFDKSYHTIAKDWRAKGMPRGIDGTYSLDDIADWFDSNERRSPKFAEKNEAEIFDGDESLTAAKKRAEVRCKTAEAERRELDNLIKRGQVMPTADVQRLFSELILAAKQRLLQLPDRLRPRFPRDLRDGLTDEVRSQVELILAEMADWRPE